MNNNQGDRAMGSAAWDKALDTVELYEKKLAEGEVISRIIKFKMCDNLCEIAGAHPEMAALVVGVLSDFNHSVLDKKTIVDNNMAISYIGTAVTNSLRNHRAGTESWARELVETALEKLRETAEEYPEDTLEAARGIIGAVRMRDDIVPPELGDALSDFAYGLGEKLSLGNIRPPEPHYP